MVLVHPSRGASGQANAKVYCREQPAVEESIVLLKALSASKTEAAIDNKIELAMDIAKSHVMLAVRQQIDELRNQIKELVDAKSRLELENDLLRSAVPPEVLDQLKLQRLGLSVPAVRTTPTAEVAYR